MCKDRVPTKQEKKAKGKFLSDEEYVRYKKWNRDKPFGPNAISIISYKAICESLGVKVPEAGMLDRIPSV